MSPLMGVFLKIVERATNPIDTWFAGYSPIIDK